MRKSGGRLTPRSSAAFHGLPGAGLALAATLALITGIIRFFAGNAGLFEAEMRRFAPPEATGLPAGEYPAMAAHIAGYLAGRKASFQYLMAGPKGESLACFHDYELIHMADCRDLIRLDGIVCGICAAAAALCALLLLRPQAGAVSRFRFPAGARRGAKQALYGLSMIAAGLVLWAAVNFDGLFITFHRLAFRNDFWLLNPRTDLLIRLMPEGMFIDLGIKGLGLFLAGEILMCFLLFRKDAVRTGENPSPRMMKRSG